MVINSEVSQEERKLKIRLGRAEVKEETAIDDYRIEALAELAGAKNQLGEFYESTKNFSGSKKFYKGAIQNYKTAMLLANKYGSSTSKHIYQELKEETEQSLERVKETENGPVKKFSITASLTGLVVGLFFITPIFTGNTIANLSSTSSLAGGGLLLIGLIAGIFALKSKQKKK